MIAHSPKMAKKAGVPQSVGKDFAAADKGKKFKQGGEMADRKFDPKKLFKGKESVGEELKEAKAIKSGKITPMQYAKGEQSEPMKKMKAGGKTSCMKTGGAVKKMASGGGVEAKSKEKTPSLDERIASDPGRAKQDIQATKEREADKGRVIRQVQGAKSDLSMTGSDPYKKASTSVMDSIPTEDPKAKSSGLTKEELAADSKVPYKSMSSKAAPAQTEGSKARAQIARMRDIYNSDASVRPEGYKKGGAVKSGASRGDGCAIRGRTKGKYC